MTFITRNDVARQLSEELDELAKCKAEKAELEVQVRIARVDEAIARQLSRSIQRNSRLENALRAAEAHIDKHLCTEGVEGAAAVLAIINSALKGGDYPAASLPKPTASELLGSVADGFDRR